MLLRRKISDTTFAEFTPLACTGLTSINDNSCTPLLSYPDTEYRSLSFDTQTLRLSLSGEN